MGANVCDSPYLWNDSAFGGSAQVNFEIQQAMILFNSHDFGHVQVSVVQQLELAPEIEIDQPLNRAMRRDNARLDTRIAYGFFHFDPFLVLPVLWTAQRDRQPFSG